MSRPRKQHESTFSVTAQREPPLTLLRPNSCSSSGLAGAEGANRTLLLGRSALELRQWTETRADSFWRSFLPLYTFRIQCMREGC